MKALDWLTEHMGMATLEQAARIEVLKGKIDTDKDKPINIKFMKASEIRGDS